MDRRFSSHENYPEHVGGETLLRQDVVNPSPDDIRAAKFHGMIEWLGTVAEDGPVLLAFDDVHWADADSLALLSYLCRRITSLPVAVVATLRPWPPAAERCAFGWSRRATRRSSVSSH